MRNKSLDLLKWVAMGAMVIDHLRYVIDGHTFLFLSVGRLAFPLFCFVMAANLIRTPSTLINQHHKKYIFNLVFFAVLSELPHRLLVSDASTFNIMPTLLLGMIFILILFKSDYSSPTSKAVVVSSFVLMTVLFSPLLEYGFLGVFLPALFYIFFCTKKRLILAITMLVSSLCTLQYYFDPVLFSYYAPMPKFWVMLGFAALSPYLGWKVLNMRIQAHIKPVKQWGYWFYPLHLLILASVFS